MVDNNQGHELVSDYDTLDTGKREQKEDDEGLGDGLDDEEHQRKKMKASNNNRIELRVLMPSRHAGAIIGKGGSNIKRLREQYQANVQVPDSTGPERVLLVSAELEMALQCLLDILPTLEDAESKDLEFDTDVRLLVHQSQAGCIIGKAGCKIQEMRETFGLTIKCYTECCPFSTDRIVQFKGRPIKIIDCVRRVFELLETAPPKGPVDPYDPVNHDESHVAAYGGFSYNEGGGGGGGGDNRGAGGGGGGGGGGAPFRQSSGRPSRFEPMRQNRFDAPTMGQTQSPFPAPPRMHGFPPERPPMHGNAWQSIGLDLELSAPGPGGMDSYGSPIGASVGDFYGRGGNGYDASGGYQAQRTFSADMVTTQVTIPNNLAGAIIGRGGAKIRSIREQSGATINIDDPTPGVPERIITIKGTADQIQNAQYLLQMAVKTSGQWPQ